MLERRGALRPGIALLDEHERVAGGDVADRRLERLAFRLRPQQRRRVHDDRDGPAAEQRGRRDALPDGARGRLGAGDAPPVRAGAAVLLEALRDAGRRRGRATSRRRPGSRRASGRRRSCGRPQRAPRPAQAGDLVRLHAGGGAHVALQGLAPAARRAPRRRRPSRCRVGGSADPRGRRARTAPRGSAGATRRSGPPSAPGAGRRACPRRPRSAPPASPRGASARSRARRGA